MFTQNHTAAARNPGHAGPGPMPGYVFLRRAIEAGLAARAALGLWLKRRRSRQVLAALDNHQLRDIGLTRADIANWSGRLAAVVGRCADAGKIQRRALADLDESRLSDLSEAGLRAWREARREHFRD